jgi:hypothetical protein
MRNKHNAVVGLGRMGGNKARCRYDKGCNIAAAFDIDECLATDPATEIDRTVHGKLA